jgi:hypothetical protein
MKHKCLSDQEEVKMERLCLLLTFLGKEQVVNHFSGSPYRFSILTGGFSDNSTDNIVSPNENLIELFYKRLCRDAQAKLEADLRKSKIKHLRKLLVHFFKLDFLPIAY